MKETKKELKLFLLLTFGITYGLGLIALLKGGLESFPVARVLYVCACNCCGCIIPVGI